jgi:hypothetical protein
MAQSPIDIDDIIGELEKIFSSDTIGIKSMLISCGPPGCRPRLWQKEYHAKRAKIMAPNVLLHHLINIYLAKIAMQQYATHMFTKPPPTTTLEGIPQHVRDNAANVSHKKLLNHSGIRKLDSTKRSSALNKIYSTMARLNYMSKEERQKIFDDVQKVVLLSIITELVKKKQAIGADITKLRNIETALYNNTHSVYTMYSLIHEYILYMYHIAPTPINTSANLLKFIENILPVLSASLSPYYEGEKDIIDFKIYLPLLEKYIELVLRESGILLAGDSIVIAESIMGIIRERICAFVQVAGNPDICIRLTIVDNVTNLIIKGVRNFLLNYPAHAAAATAFHAAAASHAAASNHDDTAMTGDDAGGSLNRNHSPIKKYKNRTKHRTMRRTKYRTKCKTKYRTSRRYKIKNKKTRKIYKY